MVTGKQPSIHKQAMSWLQALIIFFQDQSKPQTWVRVCYVDNAPWVLLDTHHGLSF